MRWFLEVNLSNDHSYIFFNLPAPVNAKEYSVNANQEAAKVVRLFNEALDTNLKDYQFSLIDVYTPTKADNGFSNGIYHCDEVHLDCSIMDIVQAQITKCNML